MDTYVITYWTGGDEAAKADSMVEAYARFGYNPESWDSHLWIVSTNYATVTNRQGDEVATIVRVP